MQLKRHQWRRRHYESSGSAGGKYQKAAKQANA